MFSSVITLCWVIASHAPHELEITFATFAVTIALRMSDGAVATASVSW